MNCKPGDLAFLSSDCVDEGVVVEVLRAVVQDPSKLPAWHCKSRTPIRCTTQRTRSDVLATDVCIEDRYLRPISGVPVHDEQHDEVKEPA